MNKWEFKVAYVDFRGRISAEGVEFIRQSGESRSAFVRRYLDVLGEEGWDLAGVHSLGLTQNSYFILRRPKAQAAA